MNTNNVLAASPLVCVLTFATVFLVPRQFWFYLFMIPIIYACVVFSRDGRAFNARLLVVLLIVSVALPTSFFTMDLVNLTPGDADVLIAPTREVIVNLNPGATNTPSLNLVLLASFWVNLAVTILVFVIPTIMIIAIVVDILNPLTSPDMSKATKGLMKAAAVVIVFIVACIVLDLFNLLPTWFVWHYVRDFFTWIIEVFSWLGLTIQSWFNPGGGAPPLPTLPALAGAGLGEVVLDASTLLPLSSGGGTGIAPGTLPWVMFNINVAIPLVLSTIPVFIYQQHRAGRRPYQWLNEYLDQPTDTPISAARFNLPALVFASIVLVYAFAVFLNFGEPGLDIGLYTVISMFAFVLLAVGALPVRTGSLTTFVEGTLLGTGGIFMFFNMLSRGLTVLPAEVAPPLITLANQVMFVAPTESLLFHVVLPGLALLGMHAIYTRNTRARRTQLILDRLTRIEADQLRDRELYSQALLASDHHVTYRGRRMAVSELSTLVFNQENMIRVLRASLAHRERTTVQAITTSGPAYAAWFIVMAFIVPNVLFSMYHQFRSPYDIVGFWVSGLAFIYLGAGAWLTFIMIRYGWLACIMSHALVNIVSLILMGVFV